jgi:type VI secretion system secreted protein Hcp
MALDSFIRLASFKGGTQDAKMSQKGCADLRAFNWGCHNSGNWQQGSGGAVAKSSFQDLSVVMYVESMTPGLLLSCALGKHIADGDLFVRKAGGENQVEYFTLHMEDILVTSVELGGQVDDERQTVRVSFNFARFNLKYQDQNKSGGAEGPQLAGYDIARQVKL